MPVRASLTALAIGAIVSSCSSIPDGCRSLELDAGYHTVPLHMSWSGVGVDSPNFTKAGCDLPLQGVIVSYDTRKSIEALKESGGLAEGRSSFEVNVNAFLYNTSSGSENKVFIVRLEVEKTVAQN